jgi:hypothetical protein
VKKIWRPWRCIANLLPMTGAWEAFIGRNDCWAHKKLG